jgi:hypothetical protein
MMKRNVDDTESWWNDKSARSQLVKVAYKQIANEMASWWNGKVMKWKVCGMGSWWNDILVKLQVDAMAGWALSLQNAKLLKCQIMECKVVKMAS